MNLEPRSDKPLGEETPADHSLEKSKATAVNMVMTNPIGNAAAKIFDEIHSGTMGNFEYTMSHFGFPAIIQAEAEELAKVLYGVTPDEAKEMLVKNLRHLESQRRNPEMNTDLYKAQKAFSNENYDGSRNLLYVAVMECADDPEFSAALKIAQVSAECDADDIAEQAIEIAMSDMNTVSRKLDVAIWLFDNKRPEHFLELGWDAVYSFRTLDEMKEVIHRLRLCRDLHNNQIDPAVKSEIVEMISVTLQRGADTFGCTKELGRIKIDFTSYFIGEVNGALPLHLQNKQ